MYQTGPTHRCPHSADRRSEGDVRINPTARASGHIHSWLTVDDICAELGVSRSTFHDWRAKGRAPKCTKLPNGSLRVRQSDYDRWLEGLEEEH
ncbi:helix-turn-helix transcriptional regulator [Nocardiopsis dassonvillei]